MSQIYDDDVYCYHNKITLKYPGIVGFNPHQDYYYWNEFGVPYPEAHAAFVAIDECTLENGCLQIIPKTHFLGTLPHDNWGKGDSDNGIKKDVYLSLLKLDYKPIPIIMEPGDVVFFHGNTIHLSNDNNSDKSRIAMLVTLNTKKASPLSSKNIGHPYYKKHERVYDSIVESDLNLPLPDFKKNY
jgi:ectoine hydroxylase-related dioxygenase (phytanoyl-CoA dioxygenase family)